MSRSVTLTTLLTRARRYADIENASARFPDAEITDYINVGLQEMCEHIRGTFGQDYYRSTYSFNTTSGVNTYALPADFLSLISVDVYSGSNIIGTLRPYMENERNVFRTSPAIRSIYNDISYYRLNGSNISLIPTPSGQVRVDVNYAPVQPNLAIVTDTFDGVQGWDDFVACHAAGMCAIKDENFDLYGIMEQRKASILARILKMAGERDQGNANRIQDVYVTDYWFDEY